MIRRYGAVLTLLTALNFMNYLDRFELAAVLPRVSADLHLSDFMGGLLSTVFLVSFLATCPLFGYLGDRIPRKYLLAAGAFAWSAATIATGLSQGATGIIIARACVGVGEASFTTLAPTVIDDVAPGDRKARALSIFHLAAPVGAALGYLVGGAVEKAAGWHVAFFVGGGPGILLGTLVLLIEEPAAHREKGDKTKEGALGLGATLRSFGPLRSYWRAVFGYTALTFATGGFAFWAPTFLYRRYNLALEKANFTFGIITVAAGAFATLLGGRLGDRVMKVKPAQESNEDPTAGYRESARTTEEQEHEDDRRVRDLLRICGAGALVAGPLAIVCFLAPSASVFFFAAFFCEMGIFLSNAPVNTALLRAVPSHLRASAMAVCITTIHLLGDLWSPPLIGKLADFAGTGKMHFAMMPLAIAFLLAGIVWFNFGGARSRARARN